MAIDALPEPPEIYRRLPVEHCQRCIDDPGWDPEGQGEPCRVCLGNKVIPNLPWTRRSKPTSRPRLTPTQVEMLRRLDCTLPDYPISGTPEWNAFVEDFAASRRARIEKMRAEIAAKWGPNGPPRKVRTPRSHKGGQRRRGSSA